MFIYIQSGPSMISQKVGQRGLGASWETIVNNGSSSGLSSTSVAIKKTTRASFEFPSVASLTVLTVWHMLPNFCR